MAAEGLQEGARQLGYTLKVETQGSVGAGNPLTAEEIAQADVVLIAADREVDRSASRASASSLPTPSPRSPAARR
jgi:PTS system fructose-specific IIC component